MLAPQKGRVDEVTRDGPGSIQFQCRLFLCELLITCNLCILGDSIIVSHYLFNKLYILGDPINIRDTRKALPSPISRTWIEVEDFNLVSQTQEIG